MYTGVIVFFVALLSGMGVGSAGLLVTWLTLVEQVPQITAQGINLMFFLFSSGAALLVHLLRTPLLFRCILLLIPFGVLGSLGGVLLAGVLPQALLRRLFGILLILCGGIGIWGKKKR